MTQKFACTIYEYKMWKIEFCIMFCCCCHCRCRCRCQLHFIYSAWFSTVKKNGKKDERLSLCPSSFPVPPSHVLSQASCFFYSKQNKKWGKLFSFVYLYEEEVRKSFVPKKVVIVCFDFFLFRKSKYSDKISISRNHIKVEKNLWIFFHCCICVRQSLRKEVYPRLGLHLKVGAKSIKVLKAYLRVESAIDRKIKRNEHETQSKFTIGATLSHVSIVSKVYMLKSKQKTFQKRKEKTNNQNRTSEEGKE